MSKPSKNCIYIGTMNIGECDFMDDEGKCIAECEGCFYHNPKENESVNDEKEGLN